MSAFQALKSRRDDITIEKLIKNCRNPEGVILGCVNIKFFRPRKAWYCNRLKCTRTLMHVCQSKKSLYICAAKGFSRNFITALYYLAYYEKIYIISPHIPIANGEFCGNFAAIAGCNCSINIYCKRVRRQ